eukprot:CAMPEP_0204597820 /NCGR_PEP_ID=MMETSP0661-20131031/54001_1 /ASSEMBLY_ACC=CAM_ASM_000606 /TAXON_ID=109239 /ORGANISM="Alexandrium margalefi, Strain AMGDE01CS-322" /LENGTH=498 /DNA_ID=CAMNT_0051608519 /DNA_START=38 /DNA_END=1534 /DNA_ORIENTATION=+
MACFCHTPAAAFRPRWRLAMALAAQPRAAPLAHGGLLSQASRWCATPSREATGCQSTPVVVLSGFLGAGKTTLLERLLSGDHGLKLGVLVNDLASVNVDAQLLSSAVERSGARSVELANGCVCCSATEDLRQGLLELLRPSKRALDAVVVELSGVAEPQNVRKSLGWLDKVGAHLDCTVTVVDAPAFATDFNAKPPARGDNKSGKEQLSALLAEQVECADVVLLNKADIATHAEMEKAEAVTRALNRNAKFYTVEHSHVPIDAVLPALSSKRGARPGSSSLAARHSPEGRHGHSHAHDHGRRERGTCHDLHCTDPSHDHRSSAERRFGIASFVYSADRPLSRRRFASELQRWQRSWEEMGRTLELEKGSEGLAGPHAAGASGHSPLQPVLRSKGTLWIDSQPREALQWSHAGRVLRFRPRGFWGDSSLNPPAAEGSDAERARLAYQALAEAELGRARNELVFIGAGVDEAAVRALLNECLLSDAELEALRASLQVARG